MIQFFRKIRQKLLSQNKISRYLFYGIGEIILVVIGILIALAINSWNEQRKIVIKERQVLKDISLNLSNNIQEFEKFIHAQSEHIRGIDIVLDYLENKMPYEDSLAFHLRKIIFTEQITANTSAYDALESFGFELIQEDELRSEIIDLFGYRYPYNSNIIRDVALQNYPEKLAVMNKRLRVNRERTMAVPTDYLALQNDQEFINWLYQVRSWKVGVIDMNVQLLEQSNPLLKNIQTYLDK